MNQKVLEELSDKLSNYQSQLEDLINSGADIVHDPVHEVKLDYLVSEINLVTKEMNSIGALIIN